MPALRPHHSAGGKPGDGNACRTRMADAIKPFAGISAPLITGLCSLETAFPPTAEGRFTDHSGLPVTGGAFPRPPEAPFPLSTNYEEIMLLKDKKCLIFGVANNRSIAYGIASCFKEHGARLAFSYAVKPSTSAWNPSPRSSAVSLSSLRRDQRRGHRRRRRARERKMGRRGRARPFRRLRQP